MVRIHDGTLITKGAAVSVPVTVTCPPTTVPPGFNSLSVQVIERSGNGVAQGFGSPDTVTCDNAPHTVDVTITDSGQKAFKNGTAFGSASLEVCTLSGPQPCTTATDSRDITISNGHGKNGNGQ
ncbi:MAG: hypothetical protein ACRDJU_01195 [Actinomycetota bacterium]